MDSGLKISFQIKALREYNDGVVAAMRATGKRLGVELTGEGLASIAYKAANIGGTATVSKLSFKQYLRYVDMGVGKGNPLGGLKAVSKQLQSRNYQGKALVKKGLKPRKLYSKVAYGRLNGLINDLLYGYTEETVARMKKEMQN